MKQQKNIKPRKAERNQLKQARTIRKAGGNKKALAYMLAKS